MIDNGLLQILLGANEAGKNFFSFPFIKHLYSEERKLSYRVHRKSQYLNASLHLLFAVNDVPKAH
jgi:hypothetical protein